MSAFENFMDIGTRSFELLTELEQDAEAIEVEVTFLISIAMSSFVMTMERLKETNPSSDYKSLPHIKQKTDTAFAQLVNESSLFCDEWKYMEIKTIKGEPDDWFSKNGDCISSKKTKKMVDILRNALAHGSIWTEGTEIDTLIFVSRKDNNKPKGPFEVLYCTPNNFKSFIKNWIKLLK